MRFVVLDADQMDALPGIRFTAVVPAGDRLWVGLQYGEVAEIDGGRVHLLPGFAAGTIRDLELAGPDGALWAAGKAALHRYDPASGWKDVAWPTSALAGDGNGGVWAAGEGGLAHVDADGAVHPLTTPDLGPLGRMAADSATGDLWVPAERGLFVVHLDGSTTVVRAHREDEPALLGPIAIVDRDGRVWIGSHAGVDLIGTTGELLAAPGAAAPAVAHWTLTGVRAMSLDREGHLWIGTNAAGLVRIEPLVYEVFEPPTASRAVRSMLLDGDRLLVTPICGGVWALARARPTEWTALRSEGCVHALARTDDGLLLGGDSADLVDLGRPDAPPVATLPADILSLGVGPRRELWIGTDGAGAYLRTDGGELHPVDGVPPSQVVTTIAFDGDGGAWLGMNGGVAVVRDGSTRLLGQGDGVPLAQVRGILVDPDGTAWLGTYGAGVVRLGPDGRVTRYTQANGLPENVASTVVDDGRGNLWFNGNRGSYRVARADLDAVAGGARELRARHFSTGEGNGGATPAYALDDSGSLWLPTVDGVARIAVDGLRRNDTPPIPVIEEVTIDGTVCTGAVCEAGPGDRDTTVRFTAAVLGHPELARFSYRLRPVDQAGLDPGWHTADERTVHFSRLGPGRWVFEVRAENEDRVASIAPAAVELRLKPALVETGAFRLAGVGAVGLVVVSAVQWQRRRNRRLQTEIGTRIRTELQLRSSEAHYRSVFEAASDALLVTDASQVVEAANPTAMRMFRPGTSLIGASAADLVRSEGGVDVGVRPGGATFPARVARVPLGEGRELWSIVDLTPEIEVRDRLAAAHRVEAVGRLAGGIAHEFNNLLTVARANAAGLKSAIRALGGVAAPLLESVDQIESVARRGAELTGQLLSFGQRQMLRPEAVDLLDLVRRAEPMLERLLRDDTTLIVSSELGRGERAIVEIDPGHTELALVNLVVRVGDIAAGPGRIEVVVGKVSGRDAAEWWPTVPPTTDYVRLTVEDTRVRRDPGVETHAFEPFRGPEQDAMHGSLGLAAVHGFVTQSRGYVFARTAAEGEAFDVLLPWVHVEPVARADDTTSEAPATTGKILVVDDDPLVRRTLERLIRAHGYAVTGANGANEALGILADDRFDLLVTDVQMPGVNGVQLAREARRQQPGLRVVFVSGYTAEVISDELDGPLLSKPFDPNTLAKVIQRVLSR